MDGRGVQSTTDSGAGVVNCAYGVGPWERFHLRDVAAEPRPKESSSPTFSASDYESDNIALTDPAAFTSPT